jgi:DNA-3-methyladenine glycosylase I
LAELKRCDWCGDDPLYIEYHDREWGVPVRNDRTLFEFLVLEGAQAGLSWMTILKKRASYRRAFDDFDAATVARYDGIKIAALLTDPGIVRNQLKVASAVTNAQAFLKVQEEYGSFSNYIWSFVDGRPIQNAWRSLSEIPPTTALAETISKDLKKRGFRFVGPTIVYAHMQATGIVNDHLVDCFRYPEIVAMSPTAD